MKFCIDCKHHKDGECWERRNLSPVDGKPEYRPGIRRMCGFLATFFDRDCGKAGQYWEPKE
jgi:hypothetical protein